MHMWVLRVHMAAGARRDVYIHVVYMCLSLIVKCECSSTACACLWSTFLCKCNGLEHA